MGPILLLAILAVAAAAIVYLYRNYADWKRHRLQQNAVESALNLDDDPETPWVNMLVKARKEMSDEDYAKFQSAVLDLVKNIGVVNRSGPKTEAERWALLKELTGLSVDGNRDT